MISFKRFQFFSSKDWRLFPTELWPKDKRKNGEKVKTKANKDVNKRLEDLVKKDEEKAEEVEDIEEVVLFECFLEFQI